MRSPPPAARRAVGSACTGLPPFSATGVIRKLRLLRFASHRHEPIACCFGYKRRGRIPIRWRATRSSPSAKSNDDFRLNWRPPRQAFWASTLSPRENRTSFQVTKRADEQAAELKRRPHQAATATFAAPRAAPEKRRLSCRPMKSQDEGGPAGRPRPASRVCLLVCLAFIATTASRANGTRTHEPGDFLTHKQHVSQSQSPPTTTTTISTTATNAQQQQPSPATTTTTTTITTTSTHNKRQYVNISDHSGLKTNYACEGSRMELSCQEGKLIHLVRANYGRFSLSICNEQGLSNYSVICTSFRAFLDVQNR